MNCLVSQRQWETRQALYEHFEAIERPKCLLGNQREGGCKFSSFTVCCGYQTYEIGVISSWRPQLVVFEKKRSVLVGHDEFVSSINLHDMNMSSSELCFVFYEFLPTETEDEVLALHETGVLRVDAYGSVIWSVDTDLVEDAILDSNGNVVITEFDAPGQLKVNVATGKTVRSRIGS